MRAKETETKSKSQAKRKKVQEKVEVPVVEEPTGKRPGRKLSSRS